MCIIITNVVFKLKICINFFLFSLFFYQKILFADEKIKKLLGEITFKGLKLKNNDILKGNNFLNAVILFNDKKIEILKSEENLKYIEKQEIKKIEKRYILLQY